MQRSWLLSFAILTALGLLGQGAAARAAISVWGDLDPADPSAWTSTTTAYIGKTADGALTVDRDSDLLSASAWIGLASGATGKLTVTGPGSTWTNETEVRVGYYGNGSLTIADGGHADTYFAELGFDTDAAGTVAVQGAGSSWTCHTLNIGTWGRGLLAITDGAEVNNDDACLGYSRFSDSRVVVSGAGSHWSTRLLFIAYHSSGSGSLAISDGGSVAAPTVLRDGNLRLSLEVNNGSQLSIFSMSDIASHAPLRLIAGAAPGSGSVHTPIVAQLWGGDDDNACQALGGTWHAATHEFIASSVAQGTSGTPVAIDSAHVQRVRVGDAATGWSLGASVQAADTSTPLEVWATAATGALLADLAARAADETVLGAWQFSTTVGVTDYDPAYLSFEIGDYARDQVTVWYRNWSGWEEFDAWDLTCDGTYASFTIEQAGSYAVTGATVPEPGVVALLVGLGGFLVLGGRRR